MCRMFIWVVVTKKKHVLSKEWLDLVTFEKEENSNIALVLVM